MADMGQSILDVIYQTTYETYSGTYLSKKTKHHSITENSLSGVTLTINTELKEVFLSLVTHTSRS